MSAERGVWPIPRPDVDDEDRYEGLLLLEPRSSYDACIVGVVERFHDRFVLYDRDCVMDVIRGFMEGDDDEDLDTMAVEHFEFNVVGGWVGESTCGFLEGDRWQ